MFDHSGKPIGWAILSSDTDALHRCDILLDDSDYAIMITVVIFQFLSHHFCVMENNKEELNVTLTKDKKTT